jgi:hypothetical protein
LPGSVDDRCKCRVQPKADIGGSGGPLAEDMPGAICEPGAAARAAAIDPEKQIGTPVGPLHALLPPESSPNWLNAPKFE